MMPSREVYMGKQSSFRSNRSQRISSVAPYRRIDIRGDVNARVFVGNLSFNTSWQNLKDHMKQVGAVLRAEILTENGIEGGRSRGCGLVQYSSAEEAANAIKNLTDSELDGRPIFVREDRVGDASAKLDSAPKGDSTRAGFRKVYIGNLAWSVDWRRLKDLLRTYGDVVRVDVAMEGDRSKGWATAEFATAAGASACMAGLNDSILEGRPVYVREDREAISTAGSRRLYIGNLAWSVDWCRLKDVLRQCGDVERVDVAMDGDRSKGWAVAIMVTAAGAAAAISRLNDVELEGRRLNIREDRELPISPMIGTHSPVGVTMSRSVATKAPPAGAAFRRLYVGNLSYRASWQDLKDHFKVCGDIIRADVATEEDGRSRGFGFVEFVHSENAVEAIRQLNGSALAGREIFVREDREA